ncbi:hypothetical protein STA3757_30490 [Stanieria sp. NIES-3757]|nr:hypothetical protein STA3757_30490 [Stanieria sp. NIES-3757]
MKLPSGKTVNPSTPIYDNSAFTWGEATKNCTRKLEDLIIDSKLVLSARQLESNIIKCAQQLDLYRAALGGRPIIVNSWYRPVAVNNSVGGAKWSQHLCGLAADIRSNYYHSHKIYQLLDLAHYGGLGRYFSFVHVDLGKNRRWIVS